MLELLYIADYAHSYCYNGNNDSNDNYYHITIFKELIVQNYVHFYRETCPEETDSKQFKSWLSEFE